MELDRAVRSSLKKTVKEGAPDAVRERMRAAMAGEKARSDARAKAEQTAGLFGWKTVVPLSAAAALALLWGTSSHGPMFSADVTPRQTPAGPDPLAELVGLHAHPLPPVQTDPRQVRAFEQYVGVPVHPVRFKNTGAKLVGGRVLPLVVADGQGGRSRQERAAMLQYEINNQGAGTQRVSVFIYDPRKIQVGGPNLAPRAVGTAEVRSGRENGYSVAVTERDDVGYALASDLDQERSAELAALIAEE
jgi:hypothetical protein